MKFWLCCCGSDVVDQSKIVPELLSPGSHPSGCAQKLPASLDAAASCNSESPKVALPSLVVENDHLELYRKPSRWNYSNHEPPVGTVPFFSSINFSFKAFDSAVNIMCLDPTGIYTLNIESVGKGSKSSTDPLTMCAVAVVAHPFDLPVPIVFNSTMISLVCVDSLLEVMWLLNKFPMYGTGRGNVVDRDLEAAIVQIPVICVLTAADCVMQYVLANVEILVGTMKVAHLPNAHTGNSSEVVGNSIEYYAVDGDVIGCLIDEGLIKFLKLLNSCVATWQKSLTQSCKGGEEYKTVGCLYHSIIMRVNKLSNWILHQVSERVVEGADSKSKRVELVGKSGKLVGVYSNAQYAQLQKVLATSYLSLLKVLLESLECYKRTMEDNALVSSFANVQLYWASVSLYLNICALLQSKFRNRLLEYSQGGLAQRSPSCSLNSSKNSTPIATCIRGPNENSLVQKIDSGGEGGNRGIRMHNSLISVLNAYVRSSYGASECILRSIVILAVENLYDIGNVWFCAMLNDRELLELTLRGDNLGVKADGILSVVDRIPGFIDSLSYSCTTLPPILSLLDALFRQIDVGLAHFAQLWESIRDITNKPFFFAKLGQAEECGAQSRNGSGSLNAPMQNSVATGLSIFRWKHEIMIKMDAHLLFFLRKINANMKLNSYYCADNIQSNSFSAPSRVYRRVELLASIRIASSVATNLYKILYSAPEGECTVEEFEAVSTAHLTDCVRDFVEYSSAVVYNYWERQHELVISEKQKLKLVEAASTHADHICSGATSIKGQHSISLNLNLESPMFVKLISPHESGRGSARISGAGILKTDRPQPPLYSHRASVPLSPMETTRSVNSGMHIGVAGQQETPVALGFNVGENVEVLCTVQNGNERWFPGILINITADNDANGEVTYDIEFKDGEKGLGKRSNQIRYPRHRGGSNTGRSSGFTRTSISVANEQSGSSLSLPTVGNDSPGFKRSNNSLVANSGRNSTELTPVSDREQASMLPCSSSQARAAFVKRERSSRESLGDDYDVDTDEYTQYDDISVDSTSFNHGIAGKQMGTNSSNSNLLGNSCDSGLKMELAALSLQEGNNEDDSDEEFVFAIPSVFEANRNDMMMESTVHKSVPRIQFGNLNMNSSLNMSASGGSLSSSLIRDNLTPSNGLSLSTNRLPSYRSDTSKNSARNGKGPGGQHDCSGGSSNATKVAPWKAAEDMSECSFIAPEGSHMKQPPSLPPNASILAAQEVARRRQDAISNKRAQQDELGISQNARSILCNSPEDDVSYNDDLDDEVFRLLGELYALVVSILLKSCFRGTESSFEYDLQSHMQNYDVEAAPSQFSNMLFYVGEFLNSEYGMPCVPLVRNIVCNSNETKFSKLLKLVSPITGVSSASPCIATCHMDSASRIGDGAFGSVSKSSCPVDCRYNWCHRKILDKNVSKTTSFAIKRISKGSSVYDCSVIGNVFNEVSCIQQSFAKCSSLTKSGVCNIFDYGVMDSEYWILMECGERNLREWRKESFSSEQLNVSQYWICMLLLREICTIMQNVHSAGIVHFDIKCDNFILRRTPDFDCLFEAYREGKLSGTIFLTDFGEAVSLTAMEFCSKNSKDIKNNSVALEKCKGTLAIQSPEMIRLSEMQSKKSINCSAVESPSFCSPNCSSDIWSLGCLTVELFTGEYLFSGCTWTELYVLLCMKFQLHSALDDAHNKDVLPGYINMGAFLSATSSIDRATDNIQYLYNFLNMCLQQMPAARCAIDEAVAHMNAALVSCEYPCQPNEIVGEEECVMDADIYEFMSARCSSECSGIEKIVLKKFLCEEAAEPVLDYSTSIVEGITQITDGVYVGVNMYEELVSVVLDKCGCHFECTNFEAQELPNHPFVAVVGTGVDLKSCGTNSGGSVIGKPAAILSEADISNITESTLRTERKDIHSRWTKDDTYKFLQKCFANDIGSSSCTTLNESVILVPVANEQLFNENNLHLVVHKLKLWQSYAKYPISVVLCINSESSAFDGIGHCLAPRLVKLPMISFVSTIGLLLHQHATEKQQLLDQQLSSIYSKLIISFYASGNNAETEILLKTNDVPLCLINYWSQFYWYSLTFRVKCEYSKFS